MVRDGWAVPISLFLGNTGNRAVIHRSGDQDRKVPYPLLSVPVTMVLGVVRDYAVSFVMHTTSNDVPCQRTVLTWVSGRMQTLCSYLFPNVFTVRLPLPSRFGTHCVRNGSAKLTE